MSVVGVIAIWHFDSELRCDIREKLSMLSNTHLWTFIHNIRCGDNFIPTYFASHVAPRAHVAKHLMCRKVSRHANVRIRRTRTHLSVSRPQQDAKFNYVLTSSIRIYHKSYKERGRPLQLSSDRRCKDRTCKGNTISW
jgi:hypothetical protein